MSFYVFQAEYAKEKIEWTPINFTDNQVPILKKLFFFVIDAAVE